jgi:hypothetical protein
MDLKAMAEKIFEIPYFSASPNRFVDLIHEQSDQF